MRRLSALALSLVLVFAASSAVAQGSDGTRSRSRRRATANRSVQVDLHGGFTWWGAGFVSGLRVGFPLIADGFVSSLDDALYLNMGGDFYYIAEICTGNGCRAYSFGLGFPIALQWQVDFDETWMGFVEVGANVLLHPSFFRGRNVLWEPGAFFLVAVGGSLKVGRNFALTLRVGNPYSVFGLTLTF